MKLLKVVASLQKSLSLSVITGKGSYTVAPSPYEHPSTTKPQGIFVYDGYLSQFVIRLNRTLKSVKCICFKGESCVPCGCKVSSWPLAKRRTKWGASWYPSWSSVSFRLALVALRPPSALRYRDVLLCLKSSQWTLPVLVYVQFFFLHIFLYLYDALAIIFVSFC